MSRKANSDTYTKAHSAAVNNGKEGDEAVQPIAFDVNAAHSDIVSGAAGGKNTGGARLKMPSSQASKFTKAYNRLLVMKNQKSAEGVIFKAIREAEQELSLLKQHCEEIVPLDDAQKALKEQWMDKYITDREKYLIALRNAVGQEHEQHRQKDKDRQQDNRQSQYDKQRDHDNQSEISELEGSRSVTSSVRQAAAEAEAEEAQLRMEQEQLAKRQEQRRKLEEQWLKDQEEQDELARKIEAARVRKEALNRAMSTSSVRSKARSKEPENREVLEYLPRLRQPTNEWLDSSRIAPPERTRPAADLIGSCPGQQRLQLRPQQTARSRAANMDDSVQNNLLQHVLLAQAKLPVFKGDPLEFMWFRRAFEAQVEEVTSDPSRRLYLLLQQLQGEPHTLVKGCQLLPDAGVAYERAMTKLTQKYGHPVRQALAFREKLMSWPAVKSAKDMEEFCTQLELCQDVKLAGNGLAELDSPATLLQLVGKLPGRLQTAWQVRVYDIECLQYREANFEDFIEFVRRQAASRNHPVYGKLDGDRREQAKGQSETKAIKGVTKTLATDLIQEEQVAATATSKETPKVDKTPDASKPPCLLCKGKHATSKCTAEGLSLKEKREKLNGLCFSCLKPGHFARRCKSRLQCEKCEGRHPTVLHVEEETARKTMEKSAQEGQTNKKQETVRATVARGDFAVAVVPVKVWVNASQFTIIRAVLDPASTATFITDETLAKIGARAEPTELCLTTMANQTTVEVGMVQGLKLSDLDGNNVFSIGVAYTRSRMPFDEGEAPEPEDLMQWAHLQEVEFDWRHKDAPVGMLIGLNVPDALWPLKAVWGHSGEPFAVHTALGWTLNGPLRRGKSSVRKVGVRRTLVQDIASKLDRLYYQDFDDAYNFSTKGLSQEDRAWMDAAGRTIHQMSNGQYVIALPFREGMETSLQTNREQALQRLVGLKKRFKINEGFRSDYVRFMKKMVDEGYVEEVQDDAGKANGAVVNYIPHHGVYHPRKPNKIRVVFNCASRFKGVSLNDCLLPGPDLTNSIIGVLMRFRQEQVPFMADIDSMFYRVLVPESQRDALRFLWWRGEEMDEVQMYRLKVHLFGAASSPSVANFALRTAAVEAFEEGQISVEARESVFRNFYVDDCLKSLATEEEAISMAKELVKACKFGGFTLSKFVSPCARLLQECGSGSAPSQCIVDLNDDKSDALGSLQERALGVAWCVASDQFKFKIAEPDKSDMVTKRAILSSLSAVYDPLGMAAPVIITARILFRTLTKQNELGWDDKIEDSEHTSRWLQWLKQLPKLHEASIPRCYRHQTMDSNQWQLHVFADASMDAYSAVAYLRQGTGLEAKVSFVIGKARVSPPKVVTVPRLELTAAKLAAEMASSVCEELQIKISQRFFWSDSETVLKYLRNKSKRFHTFVANRVCSILTMTDVEEWRYVPTDVNPADEGSRGLAPGALVSSMWLVGPHFLQLPEEQWPVEKGCQEDVMEEDPEVKKAVTTRATAAQEPFIETLARRFSSAHRFRRAVAIWLCFKEYLRGKKVKGQLSVSDLNKAENESIQWLQRDVWSDAVKKLSESESVLPRSSPLFKLSPGLDSKGMVRTNTRTRKCLPIVPSGALARLLVTEAHVTQAHLGRQSTAAAVLRKYWIVGLNKLVRSVTRECASCQRRNAQPGTVQMADLPDFRIEAGFAFQTTGVDYFGPFFVRRGRAQVKAYGAIFTCATTRAVHLEVAESLSSSSFINALRRFIARRGNVQKIVSDNGTNFSGAEKELFKELMTELQNQGLNQDEIVSELQRRGIEWHYNAPAASHHGGFWERMIRSVRRVFEALLGSVTTLTYEALTTLMCECEAVLNSRPLTPVNEDASDFEALTPNHLLLGRPGPTPPPGDFTQVCLSVRKQWKFVQHLAEEFWRRWCNEYRVLLQQKAKWHKSTGRNLKVDDVVLVMDPVLPRVQWRLGRVSAVHLGQNDNHVRVVDVITNRGTIRRPVTKLCLLETASA